MVQHLRFQFSSVQLLNRVQLLATQKLQNTRPPCPSPTPEVYPNSCPSSWWCHPAISSSVVPFSSCLQSFPASESFLMSQLFILEVKKSKLLEDICHNPRDQIPKLLGATFATVWLIQPRCDIGEWDGWCVILTQNHTTRLTEHAWWVESSSTISVLSYTSLSTFFPSQVLKGNECGERNKVYIKGKKLWFQGPVKLGDGLMSKDTLLDKVSFFKAFPRKYIRRLGFTNYYI